MNTIFNVRIYGILIENDAILVSDEVHYGREITKLPGGGLQFGEGTIECLKREFMEELGVEIQVKSHFYTADFFQVSAFNDSHQVISIYYLVEREGEFGVPVSDYPFTMAEKENGTQSFRWIKAEQLHADVFTFPIDKHVSGLLRDYFKVDKEQLS